MSPKELEEIKARHHGNEFNTCDGCVANLEDELVDYPCEAFRLSPQGERLRGVVEGVRALHQSVGFEPPVGEVCRACWTDEWPCETRAALGGEE